MKTSKKLLTAAVFIATTSAVTITQADGIFGKIFGSKGGTDFKTMMSYVPADTSYILTNKNPIPDEVMDFHLKRGQEMMQMISKMEPSASKESSAGKETSNKDEKETKDPEALFKAIFEDLGSKLSEDKFEETGLSLKATSLVYGYEMMPVFRFSFADKEKLMEMLKRAEEKSGYKVELTKCGDYDCFIDSGKDDKSVAMVILNNHFAASVFPSEKKETMIDHLTGKSNPKKAYGEDKWNAFLKENNYTGYGDGFINLEKLFTNVKPVIAEGIKANAKTKVDDKETEACLAVVEEHINNVPGIQFGTKNLTAKNMDYELVVKTSAGVSEVLQTIANKTNIAKRVEDPIFDLGININFIKLRDALTQYSNFLVKSGETHKCKNIDPKAIRKGMGGMMMAMNMGLTQFKSIYASVADIELDKKMNPEKVDAYISIGADDPGGLIGMVGMMSPALMGFQVPADGSTVKLPEGAIPSKGAPIPAIYLSRTDKTLNIMVGNDKPVLKNYKNKQPEIMSSSMDGKRYYGKLAAIMKVLPQAKSKNADQEQVSKMMESMGSMTGKMQQEVTADKRGLVMNYHIQY